MKKNHYLILWILIITMALFATPMALAAEHEPTEEESNNTRATANLTTDGATNYGKLSVLSDVDWWRVSFPYNGYANYWLQAPSGCDFDLYLYDSSGTLLEASDNSTGRQELIRYNIDAGATYYIEINTSSDTSSSVYTFRAKGYAEESARVFTTSIGTINSSATSSAILPYIWKMGYDGGGFNNNSATSAYNTFSSSSIFVIHGRGNPGVMTMPTSSSTTELRAKSYGDMTGHKAISYYSAGALNNVKLAIFCGNNTAIDNAYYGNLVTMTQTKGAQCVIGWNSQLDSVAASRAWLTYLFYDLDQGETISTAISSAKSKTKTAYPDYYQQTNKTNAVGSTSLTVG